MGNRWFYRQECADLPADPDLGNLVVDPPRAARVACDEIYTNPWFSDGG